MLTNEQIGLIVVVVLVLIVIYYYYTSTTSTSTSSGFRNPFSLLAGQGRGSRKNDQGVMNTGMLQGIKGTGSAKGDQALQSGFLSRLFGKKSNLTSGGQGTGSAEGDQQLMSSTPNQTQTIPPNINQNNGGAGPSALISNSVLSDAIEAVQSGQQATYQSSGELVDEQSLSLVPSDYSPAQARNLAQYIENLSMGTTVPSEAPFVYQNGAYAFNPNSDISALTNLPVNQDSTYNVPTAPQAFSSDTNSSLTPVAQLSAGAAFNTAQVAYTPPAAPSSSSSTSASSFSVFPSLFASKGKTTMATMKKKGKSGYFSGSNVSSTSNGQLAMANDPWSGDTLDVDAVLQNSLGSSMQSAQADYVANNRLLYPTQPSVSIETVKPAVNNAGLLHMQVWSPAVVGPWENPAIITDVPNMSNAI